MFFFKMKGKKIYFQISEGIFGVFGGAAKNCQRQKFFLAKIFGKFLGFVYDGIMCLWKKKWVDSR